MGRARRLVRDARPITCARAIAISSIRTTAGSSSAFAWRRTRIRSSAPLARLLQHRRIFSCKGVHHAARTRSCRRQCTATSLAESRQEILAGLTAAQKRLAPKYLYDERGSELFDEICSLPEYYPTRTELAVLRAHAAKIAALVGPSADVVELGAGSSSKARLLLDSLDRPGELPASRHLDRVSRCSKPQNSPPRIHTSPYAPCSPTSRGRSRCRGRNSRRTLVFFPGSTIGNLSRAHAAELLKSLRRANARRRAA